MNNSIRNMWAVQINWHNSKVSSKWMKFIWIGGAWMSIQTRSTDFSAKNCSNFPTVNDTLIAKNVCSTLNSPATSMIGDRFATHLLPYNVAKFSALRSAGTAIVTAVTRNISSAFSPFFPDFLQCPIFPLHNLPVVKIRANLLDLIVSS